MRSKEKEEGGRMRTIFVIASLIGMCNSQTLVYNKPYPGATVPTYPSISYVEANAYAWVNKTGARDYEIYKFPDMNLIKAGTLPGISVIPDSCTVQISQHVVDADDGWEILYSTIGSKKYFKLIDDNNSILLQDSGVAYLMTLYGYSVIYGYTMSGGQYVAQKVWKLRTGIPVEKALMKKGADGLISDLSNMPNPFNPATIIEFELKEASKITVEIINGVGQIVDLIPGNEYQAGIVRIPYTNNKLASGSYILKIKSAENRTVEKIILMVK